MTRTCTLHIFKHTRNFFQAFHTGIPKIFGRLVSAGVIITTPTITHPHWTGGGGFGGIFIPAPTITLSSGGLWRRLLRRLLCWRLRRHLRGLLGRFGTRHRGRLMSRHGCRFRRWHMRRLRRRHRRRLDGGMFVTTPTITIPNWTGSGKISWMTIVFPSTAL